MACKHLLRLFGFTLLACALLAGGQSWAKAQTEQLQLEVTSVDSSAFPQVTAWVLVSGAAGPRLDLRGDDFIIWEDHEQVSNQALHVVAAPPKDLHLALALDLSMSPDQLEHVKQACSAFVDTLDPEASVTLLAFQDQAGEVGTYDEDKAALKAAVEGLQRTGSRTAFNQAALKAVDTLGGYSGGRRAVILFTNRGDNVGARAAGEKAIAKAQTEGIAMYIIGFDKLGTNEAKLESMSTATRGQFYPLGDEPARTQTALQDVRSLLNQGSYRLTFQSTRQADDQEHELVIRVSHQGKQTQARGDFQATRREVQIQITSPQQGQRVALVVPMKVLTIGPAPVVRVSYRLDGQPLAGVTQPPFSYPWDSIGAAPGFHTLVAEAEDQVGNRGWYTVTFEIVAAPAITVSVPEHDFEVGEVVPVGVTIDSHAPIAERKVWVDGNRVIPLQVNESEEFAMSSQVYTSGTHQIVVQAQDSLGRVGQDDAIMNLRLPSPWTLGRKLLASLVTLAVALIILTFFSALWLLAVRVLERRPQQKWSLALKNLGNVTNRYWLRAVAVPDELGFEFETSDAKLEPVAPEAGPESNAKSHANRAPDSARPDKQGAGVTQQNDAMLKKVPSSGAVRGVAAVTNRMQGRLRLAQRFAPWLGKARAGGPSGDGRNESEQEPGQIGMAQTQPAGSAKVPTWYTTPELKPGPTLLVTMRIIPHNPYRSRTYALEVQSQAEESASPLPKIHAGQVRIQGVPWLLRLAPHLVLWLIWVIVVTLAVKGIQFFILL